MSARRTESERLADLEAKAAAIRKKQANRDAREKSDIVRKLEAALRHLDVIGEPPYAEYWGQPLSAARVHLTDRLNYARGIANEANSDRPAGGAA